MRKVKPVMNSTLYLLQNPEEGLEEDLEKAEDLASEVARLDEDGGEYEVPSASREQSHIVTIQAAAESELPPYSKEKCHHILAVEKAVSDNAFPNSLNGEDPRKPDMWLTGACECERFQYTFSEGTPDVEKPEEPEESSPVEVAADSNEMFADVPGSMTMTYQGKQYIKKAGLLWGLRQEYPKASIETEVLNMRDDFVLVKATITGLKGFCTEAHGTATPDNTRTDRIFEMAETRAISRAIRHLFALPVSGPEVS